MAKKESKHDLFLRLAKPRTQKVLNSLRILGNCSNKNSYEYMEDEVSLMFTTIRSNVDDIEAKFKAVNRERELFDF